jgi:hypothetical protein
MLSQASYGGPPRIPAKFEPRWSFPHGFLPAGRVRRSMQVRAFRVEGVEAPSPGWCLFRVLPGAFAIPEFDRRPAHSILLMLHAWRRLAQGGPQRNQSEWKFESIMNSLFPYGQEDPRSNFRVSLVSDFLSEVELGRWNDTRKHGVEGLPQLEKTIFSPDHKASEPTKNAGLTFSRPDGKPFALAGRGAAHQPSIVVRLEHPAHLSVLFRGKFVPPPSRGRASNADAIDVLFGPRFGLSDSAPCYGALASLPGNERIDLSLAGLPATILPESDDLETEGAHGQAGVTTTEEKIATLVEQQPLLRFLWSMAEPGDPGLAWHSHRMRALLSALAESPNTLDGSTLRLVQVPVAFLIDEEGGGVQGLSSLLWSRTKSWGTSSRGAGELTVTGAHRGTPELRTKVTVAPRQRVVAKGPDLGDLVRNRFEARAQLVIKPGGEVSPFRVEEVISSLVDPQIGLGVLDALSVVSVIEPQLFDRIRTEEIQRLITSELRRRGKDEIARKYETRFPELKYVRMKDGSARVLSFEIASDAVKESLAGYKISSGATMEIRRLIIEEAGALPSKSRSYTMLVQIATASLAGRYRSMPETVNSDIIRMLRDAERVSELISSLIESGQEALAIPHVTALWEDTVGASLLLLDRLPPRNLNDAAVYLSVHTDNEADASAQRLGTTVENVHKIRDLSYAISHFETMLKVVDVQDLVRAGYRAAARKGIDAVPILREAWTRRVGNDRPEDSHASAPLR